MTTPRTAVRAAAVLGATAALTLAGAGAAMATTHTSAKVDSTVSVTFALEEGELGDACGAILAPTSAVPGLTEQFANADTAGGLQSLLQTLAANKDLVVLKGALNVPFVTPSVVAPSLTVTATDVPANVYALVSFCASDSKPTVEAPLLVGNPADALTGSLSGLGGDAFGMLSSALGGGEDGGMGAGLGSLTDMMGGATGE